MTNIEQIINHLQLQLLTTDGATTDGRCNRSDLEEAIHHLERVVSRRKRAQNEAVMEALKNG